MPKYADKVAIIYEGNISKESRTITYAQLHHEVELLAFVMKRRGVGRGDRVIIYMPMVVEGLIAMLAAARIGAIHSVVFGGFSARELANRIIDSQAKLILSASCGLEPHKTIDFHTLIDEARRLSDTANLPAIFVNRP